MQMPTYRRNFSMLTVLTQSHGLQVLEDAAKLKNVAAASGLGVVAVTAAATQLRPLQSLETCQGAGGAALWPAEMQAVLDQGAAMLSTALPTELEVAAAVAGAAGAGPACGPALLGGGAAAASGLTGLGLPISGSVALAEAAPGAAGTEAPDSMQQGMAVQLPCPSLHLPMPALALTPAGGTGANFSQSGGINTVQAAEQLYDFSLLLSPAPSLSLNLEGLMSRARANPGKRPHPGS